METSNRSNYDTEVQIDPLNFIRSGGYRYDSGSINGRSNDGNYWESTPSSTIFAGNLNFYFTTLNPQKYTTAKGYGFALRCLDR